MTIRNNVKKKVRKAMNALSNMNIGSYGIHDPWMSLFGSVKAMMDEAFGTEFQNKGLKQLIHKPHNLITKKDENGNIISYSLEVVYTPFKKSDVKVVINNNTLVVTCGTENKTKDDDMIYCGISHQSYTFSLPLTDDVDIKQITASAEDGILTVNLPMKQTVIEDNSPIEIAIN